MAFFVKLSHILAIIWFLSGTTTVLQLKVIDALNTRPPNIIVVLTDDQDIVLNGMVSASFAPFKCLIYQFQLICLRLFAINSIFRRRCNAHKIYWRAKELRLSMRFVSSGFPFTTLTPFRLISVLSVISIKILFILCNLKNILI